MTAWTRPADWSTPVRARLVPVQSVADFPARCCAPCCGDKIKPLYDEEKMYEITWSDGSVSHLELGCVEWFVWGHPDHREGPYHGWCEGLPEWAKEPPNPDEPTGWPPEQNIIVTRREP